MLIIAEQESHPKNPGVGFSQGYKIVMNNLFHISMMHMYYCNNENKIS